MITIDDFTRVNNDVNGNPRYVIHFLDLITGQDREEVEETFYASLQINTLSKTGLLYDHAILKSKKLGGKKYRGKDYGGGIVFQSYNIQDTANKINELLK